MSCRSHERGGGLKGFWETFAACKYSNSLREAQRDTRQTSNTLKFGARLCIDALQAPCHRIEGAKRVYALRVYARVCVPQTPQVIASPTVHQVLPNLQR